MCRYRLALLGSASIALACSGGAPRAASTPVTRAPEPAAEVEVEVPLEDDPAPDGPACERTDECEEGRHCRGPAGCEVEWACGAARDCGESTVSYCGCDGLTFYAAEGCPGQPYQSLGPCAALGEEIAVTDVEEVEGNTICTSDDDCRRGFVCAGTPGCGTFWTCVRRRSLRCTRDRAAFCSCGGETFFSSSRCPGQPIAHAGYCPGDEPEVVAAAPPEPPREPPVVARVQPEPAVVAPTPQPPAAQPPAPQPPAPQPPAAQPPAPQPPAPQPPAPQPPAPQPPVAARPEPTPAQQPAPAREPRCMSNRDCPRGEVCTGEPGCGSEWRCERPRERCVADTQYFCACDGESFRASMTCPGRPHRHRGSCPRD